MRTIIQDTWNQPDDLELIEFMLKNKIKFSILSKSQILKYNSREIDALFCDTKIIQLKLQKDRYIYNVPKTYPECFHASNDILDLYHRKIQIITLQQFFDSIKDLSNITQPFFIKPFLNDKSFNALVVNTKWDVAHLKSTCKDPENTKIYISEPAKFINEFRLFIGKNKIYGIVESSNYILDPHDIRSVDGPPKTFIQEILKRIDHHAFYVVDVGMLSTGKWAVVEVNPPFSLSSYDLDIKCYYNFCKDAWKNIIGMKQ
tara:strand:+ start:2334 stop:3110 length:777 start_codon:yes stop_codon:yes gene_type:complete